MQKKKKKNSNKKKNQQEITLKTWENKIKERAVFLFDFNCTCIYINSVVKTILIIFLPSQLLSFLFLSPKKPS